MAIDKDCLLNAMMINTSIKIVRPRKDYLYIFDREIMPYKETFIIGKITVVVEAEDEEKRIERVEFYLTHIKAEYEPRYICYSPPYEWLWNEFAIGIKNPYYVIAGAYYSKNRAVVSDRICLRIINL